MWCSACEWNIVTSLQIALLLLENGADPNATDKLDSTPLHRAAAKGNYRLIQLLLKQSASTNILDSQGNTPLYDYIYVKCNFFFFNIMQYEYKDEL